MKPTEAWKKSKKQYLKSLKVNDALDSQEFYELMHAYRHAPLIDQRYVIKCFEDVKEFIRKEMK